MKDNNKESIKSNNTLYKLGIIFTILILIGYIVVKTNHIYTVNLFIPCIINKVTGYYCPGCGGTRAVLSLFHGYVFESLKYNPVVAYGVFLFLWYMATNTIEKISKGRFMIGMNYKDRYIWIGFGIMMINFLLKNISIFFTGTPGI